MTTTTDPTGTIAITAATGGTLATITYPTGGVSQPLIVPIKVAGGGSGNAITVATAGAVSLTSAAVIGYVG